MTVIMSGDVNVNNCIPSSYRLVIVAHKLNYKIIIIILENIGEIWDK